MEQPTNLIHYPTLMWWLILALASLLSGLIFILGWFIRREFSRFDNKLTEMCISIRTKSDDNDNEKTHEDLWDHFNNHGHRIECSGDDCKPHTCGVIVHD
jgi:hypothetical protein